MGHNGVHNEFLCETYAGLVRVTLPMLGFPSNDLRNCLFALVRFVVAYGLAPWQAHCLEMHGGGNVLCSTEVCPIVAASVLLTGYLQVRLSSATIAG